MSLVDFNAQENFDDDWTFYDDLEDARFYVGNTPNIGTVPRPTNQAVKVRPLSISSREYQQFSAAVGLNPTDRVLLVWAASSTLRDLESSDRLDIAGQGWIITNVQETGRGYWRVSVKKAVTNV